MLTLSGIVSAQEKIRPAFTIYNDNLVGGCEDWSWDCERHFDRTDCVCRGRYAIAVTYTKGWGTLAFATRDGISTRGYKYLQFDINGGEKGQQMLRVAVHNRLDNGLIKQININNPRYIAGGEITKNEWKYVKIPLGDLNAENIKIYKINIINQWCPE